MLEETNATIIGGSYYKWQVFYEDRPQSQVFPADSEADAETQGKALIDQLLADAGRAAWLIYPNRSWSIRIWEPQS